MDEFQGYWHEDFCPGSYPGTAEALPPKKTKLRVLPKFQARLARAKRVVGFDVRGGSDG